MNQGGGQVARNEKARLKRALRDGGRADDAAPGGVSLNDRFPRLQPTPRQS